MSRRALLAGATAVIAATALPRPLFAKSARETPLHGLSAFGDLKYPPGFRHFDYASPDAPKGGRFHFQPSYWFFNQNTDTFNTLNSFVRRGDAPPRMELCFDSLMVRALDEPDAIYGLLAETVTISDDANAYTFKLRENARWHDGTPLTAEDVAWTYMTLKEIGHPALALPLARLAQAEGEGPGAGTMEALIQRQLANADRALGGAPAERGARPMMTQYDLTLLNVETRFPVPKIIEAVTRRADQGEGHTSSALCFHVLPGT
ncbi:MAG TPA: ABC transporter substrate-binding protein, partial [Rhizobiaceae bacterium]|nr:ABC transporter substrate-binding protein [Rhizobiaceae bacterium]